MKKCIVALLCACILFTLAVPAFASDSLAHYWEEYRVYIPAPSREQYSSDEEYSVAYDAWYSGLQGYIEEQEKARIVAEKEAAEKAADIAHSPKTIESVGSKTTESAGSKNDVSSSPADASADTGLSDKYPVGSYVSPAGNVYSPDGELLSPGTTPAVVPDNALASGPRENGALLSGELDDPDGISANADVDTLTLIAGFVSDIATDPPVSTIEDLRPADAPVEVLTGLKALVTSIFGEYTPVTTTSVISQTVGNDTQQYLIETVAPGAAGVDYEWVAGVLLFAIMLFCLMKLLGGVLK